MSNNSEGLLLAGKYRILQKVGEGGMSEVFLAYDQSINKQWAVKKVKKKGKINSEEAISKLMAEASLMTKLDHPALPRIVEIIEQEDEFYLVMDFIEGKPLTNALMDGPQSQENVISWGIELCDVLCYLHSLNPPIIYRDMKPANIMLVPGKNSVKVIDFGIARTYKENKASDTMPLGTQGYAAPEQFEGAEGQTDERTDIYNLGVTLYHLVTGHDPTKAPFVMKPIRYWNKELSVGLEKIILRCTKADPNERYQSAKELMEDLMNYEKLEDSYIEEQSKTIKKIFMPLFAGIFSFLIATALFIYDTSSINNKYDLLISDTGNSSTRIENLKSAIALKPKEIEAYTLLLEEYIKIGFNEKSAEEILSVVNKNKGSYNKTSEDYLDLNYMLGETFLVYYEGQSDNSIRNKIMTALPYFQEVVEYGNSDYRNYDISKSYVELANFYKNYIIASNSLAVKEVTVKEYNEILNECNSFISSLVKLKSDNGSNLQLVSYNVILNLLDNKRLDMALQGIKKMDIIRIVEDIYKNTSSLEVSSQISSQNKEKIILLSDEVKENVENTYQNLSKVGDESA